MASRSDTWLFNIRPENWETCVAGPQDAAIHGAAHIGNPVQGVRANASAPLDQLESGDLALARIKGEGIRGIWEIDTVVDITDDPSRNLWDDDDYAALVYCTPIQAEFDEPYEEDWQAFAEHFDITMASATGQIQGSVVNLNQGYKRKYLIELLDYDGLSRQARERLETELLIKEPPFQNSTFWNFRAGEGGDLWELWNEDAEPKITIGWDIGDPETVDFEDAATVEAEVDAKYGGGPTNPAEQLRQFVAGASPSMEPGDFVVIHGNRSILAIAQVGDLQYQDAGLEGHSGHTYWRDIDYLVCARGDGIEKRSLPAKFGQDGNASVYFNQSHRTIEELTISPEMFQELGEVLAEYDGIDVTAVGAMMLDIEQTGSQQTSLSATHQRILKQWGTVARTEVSGAEFDFKKHDRTKDICVDADAFIDEHTEEHFKQMWDRMHSAVQRGSAAERLKQWEGSLEELATLIREMRDADAYDPTWRDQLGGKTTVWELFGSLHIEDYPIINAATIAGLEFFGYDEPSTYEEGLELVSDFREDYEQIVGHATANAGHDVEVPILLEIDQLFNVIDKADEESIEEESSEAARELYQQVLAVKAGDDEMTEQDEYASVQAGVDDVLEKLGQAGEQNWLRDEISEATVSRWIDPLKAVNHRPQSALEVRRCDEILELFTTYESRLTTLASHLDIKRFSQLSPAASLFVGLLRDIQSDYVDEGLINHVKFKGIRDGYHRKNRETDSYFILRTGSEEYDDTRSQYEFRDGIPGYKQLLNATNTGEAIFLEDGEFYAMGRIGEVRKRETTDFEGEVRYAADIIGFQEFETPISQEVGHSELEVNLNRPSGIISFGESDFEKLVDRAFAAERAVGGDGSLSDIELDTDHPLLEHLEPPTTARVFKFTASVEYWYTALRNGALAFSEGSSNHWNELSEDDVVIFHSQAESAHPDLADYPSGILGAGIVSRIYEKQEKGDWWIDEYLNGEDFPLLAQFKRLFTTPGADTIDFRKPITQHIEEGGLDTLHRQLETITGQVYPYEHATDLRKQTVIKEFQPQKKFGELTADTECPHLYPRALLTKIHEQLVELPVFNLYEPFSGSIPQSITEGLYFPDDQGDRIRKQIQAALKSGKHIIFTGPPGTGKTVLARRVAETLTTEAPWLFTGHEVTTATADWSTFETVGGYMPDPNADVERLKFTTGSILGRLRDRQTGRATNETVVIDEINRADIDKAFGQLLTALTGESVQLPYTTDDGDELSLVSAANLSRIPAQNEYAIPQSWTILATMNTRDKTSLYDLSYAFMRRFAQIRVGAPRFDSEDEAIGELEKYIDTWSLGKIEDETVETLGHVWHVMNSDSTERSLGPALMRDMLAFVSNYENLDDQTLTDATISYVLPQLEGVRDANTIVSEVASVSGIDAAMLEEAARDMLQIKGFDTE